MELRKESVGDKCLNISFNQIVGVLFEFVIIHVRLLQFIILFVMYLDKGRTFAQCLLT